MTNNNNRVAWARRGCLGRLGVSDAVLVLSIIAEILISYGGIDRAEYSLLGYHNNEISDGQCP
jgi:hypothetical protein